MKELESLKDYIIKSKIETQAKEYFLLRGNEIEKILNTPTNDFIFLEDTKDVFQPKPIESYVYASDYAVMNGISLIAPKQRLNDRKFVYCTLREAYSECSVYDNTCVYKSFDSSVDNRGIEHQYTSMAHRGICPTLHLNLEKVILSKTMYNLFKIGFVKNEKGKVLYHTIEFGYYPQDKVKSDKAQQLEKMFRDNKLISTGKKYRGYMSKYGDFQQNEEFEIAGRKYVRVTSKKVYYDSEYKDGTKALDDDTPMWVEVQPIKWAIKNWDELPTELNPNGNGTAKTIFVRTEDAIIPGTPFFPKNSNNVLVSKVEDAMWQNSPIRAYLNGYDIYEELNNGNGDVAYKNDRNFDFKDNSFMNEAFDKKVCIDLSVLDEQGTNTKKPLSPAEIARNELIKKALERKKQAQQSNNNSEDNENTL